MPSSYHCVNSSVDEDYESDAQKCQQEVQPENGHASSPESNDLVGFEGPHRCLPSDNQPSIAQCGNQQDFVKPSSIGSQSSYKKYRKTSSAESSLTGGSLDSPVEYLPEDKHGGFANVDKRSGCVESIGPTLSQKPLHSRRMHIPKRDSSEELSLYQTPRERKYTDGDIKLAVSSLKQLGNGTINLPRQDHIEEYTESHTEPQPNHNTPGHWSHSSASSTPLSSLSVMESEEESKCTCTLLT